MRQFCDTRMLLLLPALAILALSGQAAAQASQGTQPPLLTAVGDGEVRVAPDLAMVQLGVDTEAKTAAEAREQNATLVGKIIQAIKALGIPENQIRTSMFQIQPVRRWDQPNQQGMPPIVGYTVSNIITVRTETFDLVPRIIDDSVGAGANRVDSVSFVLRDDKTQRQTALKQAVANARANAQTMAGELKVKLVSVYSVQQGGVGVMPPSIYYRGASEAAPAPTPILPGEVTVNASVTLSYIIR